MTVLAFVDYWPGLSPYKEAKNGGYMDFAVMNYDYVNVQTSMEPYEVKQALNPSPLNLQASRP